MTTLDEITYIDWQPKLNSIGEVAQGADDINQCIAIILLTRKGSVPHRPAFGSNVYKYIDYPINEIIPNIVREVTDSITEWETRITLNSIAVEINETNITTDYVQVLSPEKIDFDILVNVILYLDADEETVLTSISEKLEEYKLTLSSALGKDVIQTQIITIINSVYGVFKVELESPEDIEISEFQWANLENYSITVGGYEDE